MVQCSAQTVMKRSVSKPDIFSVATLFLTGEGGVMIQAKDLCMSVTHAIGVITRVSSRQTGLFRCVSRLRTTFSVVYKSCTRRLTTLKYKTSRPVRFFYEYVFCWVYERKLKCWSQNFSCKILVQFSYCTELSQAHSELHHFQWNRQLTVKFQVLTVVSMGYSAVFQFG